MLLFLVCSVVHISKISDKSDKFLLHYSNFFRGPLFIGTQCIIEWYYIFKIRYTNVLCFAADLADPSNTAAAASGSGPIIP